MAPGGRSSQQESTVLEEEFDENYEPDTKEIDEYAAWLGMDPVLDKELMWIAKEGLKAPLPPNWKPCKTPEGELYYFNFATGDSEWDHPCDEHYKSLYKTEKDSLKKRKDRDVVDAKKKAESDAEEAKRKAEKKEKKRQEKEAKRQQEEQARVMAARSGK